MSESGSQVELSARQRAILEGWMEDPDVPPHLADRAWIVLMSSRVVDDAGHAEDLGVDRRLARRWRERWSSASERLASTEEQSVAEDGDVSLAEVMREVLENVRSPGANLPSVAVRVSDRQRPILNRLVRNAADTPHRLLERSRMVLMSSEGMGTADQARVLGVDRQRVRRMRRRWAGFESRLAEAEAAGATDKDLTKLVTEALADAPRSGAPGKFTAEEFTQIISVACEQPEDCGRPVTHWTPRELADEVMKRGIVESISPRHVGRFLKKGLCGPITPGIG